MSWHKHDHRCVTFRGAAKPDNRQGLIVAAQTRTRIVSGMGSIKRDTATVTIASGRKRDYQCVRIISR